MKEDVKDYIQNLSEIDKLEMLSLVSNLDKPNISERDRQAVLITTFIADKNDLQTFLDQFNIVCDKDEFFTKFLTDDEFYAQISSSEKFAEQMQEFETWAEGVKEYIDVKNDLGCSADLITDNSSILSPFQGFNPKKEDGSFVYAFTDKEKIDGFNKVDYNQNLRALGVDRLFVGTNKRGHILYRSDKSRSGDYREKDHFFSGKVDTWLNYIRNKKLQYKRICSIVGDSIVDECMGTDKQIRKGIYVQESSVERVSNLIYDISLQKFVSKKSAVKNFVTRAVMYFAGNEKAEPTKDDVGYAKLISALLATKYVLKYIDLDKYATAGTTEAVLKKLDSDIALVASKCDYKKYVMLAGHETAKQIAKDFFNNREASFNSIANMFTNELDVGGISSFNEAMFRTIYNPAEVEISTMLGVEVPKDNIANVEAEEEVIAEPSVEANTEATEEATDEEEIVEENVQTNNAVAPQNGQVQQENVDEEEIIEEPAVEQVEPQAEVQAEEQVEQEVEQKAEDSKETQVQEEQKQNANVASGSHPHGFVYHTKEEIDAYLARKRGQQASKTKQPSQQQADDKTVSGGNSSNQTNSLNNLVYFPEFHDEIIERFQSVLFDFAKKPNSREIADNDCAIAYYKSIGAVLDKSFLTEEDIDLIEAKVFGNPDNDYTRLFDDFANKAMGLERLFDSNDMAESEIVKPYADELVKEFDVAVAQLRNKLQQNNSKSNTNQGQAKPANPSKSAKKSTKQSTYTLEDMQTLARSATNSVIAGAIKSFSSTKPNNYNEKYDSDYNKIADRIVKSLKDVQEYMNLPESEKASFRAKNPNSYYGIVDFEKFTLEQFEKGLFKPGREFISEQAKTRIMGEYKQALHNKLADKLKNQAKGVYAGIQRAKRIDLQSVAVAKLKMGMVAIAERMQEQNAPKSIVKELNRFANKGVDTNYILKADEKIAKDNNLLNDICNKLRLFIIDLTEQFGEKDFIVDEKLSELVADELVEIEKYVTGLYSAKTEKNQEVQR